MTVDPRWSFWLSLSLAVLAFLSGAGSSFVDLGMPDRTVKAVLGLIAIMLGIGNAVNAVLAAIPSKSDSASLNKFYLGPTNPPPPTDLGK